MTYDVAVILSGVESQRTIIEEILFNRFSRTTLRVAFVRGTDTTPAVSASNITVFGICGTADLHDIILSSRLVVCRSGYSSVMDLIALGAKALLIPTPGQTEQEYLARYLSSRGWFASVSQQDVTSLSDDDMFALVARTRPHPLVAHSNGVIFFR
jgi:UDP-N-acetylglucosamine transferase subunit ALG13